MQAPTTVDMGRRITETLGAEVSEAPYALDNSKAHLLSRSQGRYAGLEVAGDLARLRAMWASEVCDA